MVLYLKKPIWKAVQEAALMLNKTTYELLVEAVLEYLDNRNINWRQYLECLNCKKNFYQGAFKIEEKNNKIYLKCSLCRYSFPLKSYIGIDYANFAIKEKGQKA